MERHVLHAEFLAFPIAGIVAMLKLRTICPPGVGGFRGSRVQGQRTTRNVNRRSAGVAQPDAPSDKMYFEPARHGSHRSVL